MTDLRSLNQVDPEIAALVAADVERQRTHLHFIASENHVSRAVLEATGSVLTNKYSEGYPGRRYYEGCEVVDRMEDLARQRARDLFGAEYSNVQPHSGSQANQAAYQVCLEPGDKVMGMRLDQGGHLTHGSAINFSGMLYDFVFYGVDRDTELVDMDEVRRIALEERPRVIMAGYSAYSRLLDWAEFRAIADEIGARLIVDTAHIIGLIAGGAHPSPVPHAHIVTATSHKALRGPRGGFLLAEADLGDALDKAVFPGSQGGSIGNILAAKAVCFREAAAPEFADYAARIVSNASAMADEMAGAGIRIVSGGTDNHLFLVDLRSVDEDLDGREAARVLQSVGITLNANEIPHDPRPPFRPSGIRIGTPAATTSGLGEAEVRQAARMITRVLREHTDESALAVVRAEVAELAAAFPAYPPEFPGHA